MNNRMLPCPPLSPLSLLSLLPPATPDSSHSRWLKSPASQGLPKWVTPPSSRLSTEEELLLQLEEELEEEEEEEEELEEELKELVTPPSSHPFYWRGGEAGGAGGGAGGSGGGGGGGGVVPLRTSRGERSEDYYGLAACPETPPGAGSRGEVLKLWAVAAVQSDVTSHLCFGVSRRLTFPQQRCGSAQRLALVDSWPRPLFGEYS
ncbi:unnamed protein product [Merluccius merluccius]